MADWATIILRILDLLDRYLAVSKQREHQRAVDKIKHDPAGAWAERFGRVPDRTNEASVQSSAHPEQPAGR